MTEEQALELLISVGVPKTKAKSLNKQIGLELIENSFKYKLEGLTERKKLSLVNSCLSESKTSYEKKIVKFLGESDQILVSNVWELCRCEIMKVLEGKTFRYGEYIKF